MASTPSGDEPEAPEGSPGEVTRLLRRVADGDASAHDELLRLVYAELRQIAAAHVRRERDGHSLQPTAVVHEAWLRLAGGAPASYDSRTEFLAVAASVMRHVLVDHARARNATKRGGDWLRVTLDDDSGADSGAEQAALVLSVHGALEELATLHPRQAQVVELRWFGGMSVPEVAAHLGQAPRTIEKDWTIAKAWLRLRLDDGKSGMT